MCAVLVSLTTGISCIYCIICEENPALPDSYNLNLCIPPQVSSVRYLLCFYLTQAMLRASPIHISTRHSSISFSSHSIRLSYAVLIMSATVHIAHLCSSSEMLLELFPFLMQSAHPYFSCFIRVVTCNILILPLD